jgi:hypothetical protein
LDKIKKLSESDLISEKLLAINLLLSILLASLLTAQLFAPNISILSIDFFILFLICLLISFIIGNIYARILEVFSNLSGNTKIGAIRISVITLLVNFPIAVAGVSLHVPLLIKIAFGILVTQPFIVLLGGILNFPAIGTNDQSVKSSQLGVTLGDVGSIASVVGLILTIIFAILGN